MNIYYYTFFYFFIPISTIGYGLTFLHLSNNQKINNDFGYAGLFGVFFLIAYSYITHLFLAHSAIHNLVLVIVGFFLFIFFSVKRLSDFKKKILFFLIVFLILYISSFIFKTHDDFPYYHFSYSYHLTQNDLIIGIGKFNHGYRTPSSIFYLNSLFYLPKISYYLFHISAIMIMGFSNIILLSKIQKSIQFKKINFLSYYCLLAFIFINIFFYRLGEHGTDRSAQILIFLLVMEIIIFTNYEKDCKTSIGLIYMLMAIIISLKAFYILYFIFFIPIILNVIIKNNLKNSFLLLTNNMYFLFFFIIIFFILFNSLVNTGCLLYPVKTTCINALEWSIPLKEVQLMNDWYEQWSKGGAAPNFRVDNPEEYIQYFNWVSNWIDTYFFNKVSDFLFGVIFIALIVLSIFFSRKKVKVEKKINSNLIFVLIIVLLFEWFYNHPALRYGGYVLIGLIVFIPIASRIEQYENTFGTVSKKIYFLIMLVFIVFIARNMNRIFKEVEQYHYKPLKNVYYYIDKNHFRITDQFSLLMKAYEDCVLLSDDCSEVIVSNVMVTKKFGKYIFINKE
tara:strand:- start:2314 stop:4002 length:1689 start_codon:yes stop_codon:yes gene_type:complete